VIEARKGPGGSRKWELFSYEANLDIVPFTAAQQHLALEAWRKYGKGRHGAGLNIGDCCAYALAAHTGEPLLYKGDEFSRTDISGVEYS
jgi:ribonuclease VapC